jgi:hypothetical protein
MNPEKRNLINDLLENSQMQSGREATLLAGRRRLRHKRWRRAAIRTGVPGLFLVIAAVCAYMQLTPHPRSKSMVATPKPAVIYLTDDQLLALFPDTPVALATVNHRKVLIFPRPGDKERFVGNF